MLLRRLQVSRIRGFPVQTRSFTRSLRLLEQQKPDSSMETPQTLQESRAKFDLKYADKLSQRVKE